jgi:uncharacterized membrane protein YdjX (TVP38/TMEM64 family)
MAIPMKWRLGIVLLLVVAAVLVMASGFDVSDLTQRFVESLKAQGDLGLVWLALAYIPVSVFFFPAALLTLAGGFTFGFAKTLIAVSLGSTVGATSAFLAGRTLLRGLIEHKVASDVRFRTLDAAVTEQGFKIVLLTRLSPVLPFNLLNYAFGLTKVRLRDFVLASWIGMFPGTVLYVSIGSAAKNLSDILAGRSEGGGAQKILFGVGVVATLVVTVLMARIAKKALADATAAANASDAEGKPA